MIENNNLLYTSLYKFSLLIVKIVCLQIYAKHTRNIFEEGERIFFVQISFCINIRLINIRTNIIDIIVDRLKVSMHVSD